MHNALSIFLFFSPFFCFSQAKEGNSAAASRPPTICMHCAAPSNVAANPLILISGYVLENTTLKRIDPLKIISINVIKTANKEAEYGPKAKDGIIDITVKPEYLSALIKEGIIKPVL